MSLVVTVLKNSKQFTPEHVQWLARQIGDDAPMVCLSDVDIEGVDTIPLAFNFPGWWSKMEILRPDLDLGDFLFLDLDTVVLGDISRYTDEGDLTVLSCLSNSPWINSGMMYVTESAKQEPWEYFMDAPDPVMQQNQGGDQQFLHKFWVDAARWQDKYPGEIVSYKRNILKEGFLGNERVVMFHGKPRPWEANEEWIPKFQDQL